MAIPGRRARSGWAAAVLAGDGMCVGVCGIRI